ncbi:hypothetical protein SAMD00019534_089330 [Acytostelium subglobosum LB1]|uniref:hypothetical protein n=1 Tax=Acytostelium subglobosum LB1 TaxID=1410327 RepID=UPI00064522BE|nr:hypothetical protein SAMD00019534_089330 [Acytostelium subglobosum LB1]GAM25758.1 hypothetical protein SAMD00019534_089330 [Acytostelium subglobosum LB1]|eukprot:XP_012751276.1 hypothetical protein SAMD00019534_089330 [Acytostelium subglobosum LB1]
MTFVLEVTSNLVTAPTSGTKPVIFASTNFPNENHWYVAATSDEPLTSLTQTWEIDGGCYGEAGRIYIVACLPREGVEFTQGQQMRGPPFDGYCLALGSYCGGTCSSLVKTPPYCLSNNVINNTLLLSSNSIPCSNSEDSESSCTDVVQDSNTLSSGAASITFLYLSFMSLISFMVQHFSPFGAALQRFMALWHPNVTEEVIPLNRPPLPKWKGRKRLCNYAAVSVLCSEGPFHFFRNIFGVAHSFSVVGMLNFQGFVRQFYHLMSNPRLDTRSLWKLLCNVPFSPTDKEMEDILPSNINDTIGNLIDQWNVKNPPNNNFNVNGADDNGYNFFEVDTITNSTLWKNAAGLHAVAQHHKQLSNAYLAIFDARHMVGPKFWRATVPEFGKKHSSTLRFVQVMQYFPMVNAESDTFDRNNFNNYLYMNPMRDQIGTVTSCGTNALWRLDGDFELKKLTFIEDTESSHWFPKEW